MSVKNNLFVPLSVLLIVTLLGCLLVSCNSKAGANMGLKVERFAGNMPTAQSVASLAGATADPSKASTGLGDFGASDPNGDEMYNPVIAGAKVPGSPAGNCFPRDRLSADDLLPKGAADSRWAQANPNGQGDIKDQNFLTAGYHVGINTVGSSMKNANRQLRSEPPNPQLIVSPWNQASIEPDYLRKPLEIGGDM